MTGASTDGAGTEGVEMDGVEMDGVGMYRSGRERQLALGRSLGEEQAELTVAATPEWSVRDNFAHMAGVAADLLAGRVEGVATDPWTQAQVDARSQWPLGRILDELEELGPAMDEVIAAFGDGMDPRLFLDQWTHEQDIRGTVGVPGGMDARVVSWGAGVVVPGWMLSVARAGLPGLRVECGDAVYSSDDDPAITLRVEPFEAIRIVTGRRSAAQMGALGWSGTDSPEVYFDSLVVFSIADEDIHDAL